MKNLNSLVGSEPTVVRGKLFKVNNPNHLATHTDNPTNLKQGEGLKISIILKRNDFSLFKYSVYISYVNPLLPELEKGRNGTVLGDYSSCFSL